MAAVGALSLAAIALWFWRSGTPEPIPSTLIAAPLPGGVAEVAPPQPSVLRVPALPSSTVERAWRDVDGEAVLLRPDGSHLGLTLHAGVQLKLEQLLDRTRVPYAAIVLVEPSTGAVRAFVERAESGDPVADGAHLVAAVAPAASIFKIVSAAALVEAGATADTRLCFRRAPRGLTSRHIHGTRFGLCESLATALARSRNGAFGRASLNRLAAGDLDRVGRRFFFGEEIPFDMVIEASAIDEGEGDLDRARTAAGFRGTTLSPLHGAVIAAAIANSGQVMRPYLVARDSLQPGLRREHEVLRQVVAPEVAAQVGAMMVETVRIGTGRKRFARRRAVLKGMSIAGKTGTLNSHHDGVLRQNTWFVGFAPAVNPTIAISVLAVNGQQSRAIAAGIARDALATWFERPEPPAR